MNPTLSVAERERILKLARAASLERNAPKSSPIVPVERGGRLAPSFAQQRLWFLEQLGELGSTYHVPMRLRLRGALDRAALARALERIVARHESLRTVFVLADGEPEQRILPVEESGFALVEHDLRGEPRAEAEAERLVSDEADAPFDFERGPLVRARLLRLADDDHLLLLTMHHVVSDAWSMGVLIRELSTLYTAFSQGQPDPLPALPVQYADYAAWQRRRVDGEVLNTQAAYWTHTLAGAPELLELPTDHARPARQDHEGALLHVELGRELTAGLTALSHRHGTTLYMTLLAGWAVVLARLSGQNDVVVGTPSANRARPEVEELIGFFVNTLPVRVDLSARPAVAELLAQVKTRTLEGQRNQDIPFEQVVERLRPARSLAYSPLFQVMFAWQEAAGGALELPGLQLAPADSAPHVTAKFDLLLSLGEEDGQLVGVVEYATSLFERSTVERWMGYLRAVLEAMAADDGQSVDRFLILSEAERRQVLREWNATDASYPREACVHELFEAQAVRTPGAVAVVFEGERVTYAQLNARANRLAHHLRALGVGADVRVGICVERSVEMVVGLLGILKAGGAYVPLDASYPVDRLRFMLEDSAPAVLLTHPPLAATVAELSAGSAVPVLDLTGDEAWAHRPETNPGRDGLGPRNLAHVLFTSGSTGRPKGVMLEHGSLVNRLAWMQDRYGMEAHEALLQKTPFSFDVSFWEFFWPLMVGARLVMARPGGHRDPAYLADVIRREGITTAHFVPSMLQLFLEHPDAEKCTGLLRVPVSGEAISASLVRQFHERLPGVGLFNQYGPTESGEVTEWACDPDAERVSIGRAIHNSAVYVLDRAGEPVPVGVAGELFIGGVAVARGYLGRPRLTAERFVPDPFGESGVRMYRTGDLCRWLEESAEVRECVSAEVGSGSADSRTNALTHSRTGFLEYLGRTDFQVKVRGFRVELGEIEARLAAHPGIREAVVLAPDDGAGGKRLVAYFVGEALGSEALRAHLAEQLPEYMVPAAFVRLESFPLNPNGKLDRKALPAPDADAFAARAWEAPLGEMEEALAAIWSELLGAERVGRGDDFFALGGHSLLAVRVVSRVRQALGVEAGISDLFVRPVLADFARGLQTATGAAGTAIVPVDRSGPLALSFAQQRLWFIEQMEGSGAAYHLPMRLWLKGELDREALMRALERIVARHEALRTSFPETDGVPVQRISAVEESPFHLIEHDLRAAPDAEGELRRLVSDEASAPFDLARSPLVRGRLIRLAGDDHVLLVTMHHIVSDGWSMGIFTRELSALYAAFRDGRPDPLPPLPVQYADYAAWQRRWVDGEVLQRQADYWRETLSGAPELLELPTDHARPARQDLAGAWLQIQLDEALTAALKTLGQRHGATLHMTLLAGWAAVLARLSGQDDVVVGTPTANRGRAEVEELIGFFVNTLALRVDLSGAPSVAELLGRVKERSLGAQHHQDIPFEQVVERVQPARSLAHTPLFQTMFTWQNAPEGRLELPGLALGPLDPLDPGESSSQVAAKFDLSLALWEDGGRIEGVVDYATALFERETVERWLGYLRRALEEMAADDAKPVDRLELLSAAERRLVVEEWNATDAGYPAGACVHELLRAQVARTPEAIALSWRGERWTYAELEVRANRIASELRRRGVGPEVRVGICLPRTPELVAAMLGVLKAGGAYVPLDPAYPRERLGYMLEDAGIALVITESSLADRLPEGAAGLLLLDGDRDAMAAESVDAPESGAGPENLSHVIFTSGSTGRPKGVMIRHSSVVVLLHWLRENVTDEERSSVLFSTSINFDVSIAEVFGTLAWGGKLVIAENALELATLDEEVAYVSMVPSAAAELLRSGGIPACVKTLNMAGEALPNALAQGLYALETVEKVGNLYGPTEDTTYSTYSLVPRGADQVLIGTPVANTQTYVLDHHLQPVPAGVVGELYLAGDGLSRGYANQPAMTAERFIPAPFGAPGARMYRVMDRVRWKESASVRECVSAVVEDSREATNEQRDQPPFTHALPHSRTHALEYLGRTDFQVKVRGYRIELGEIEARLASHADVREAVVLAREDAPGDVRLVAYLVGDADAEALRLYLAERLPEYMLPAAYVRLETLPLTPNGKVDRKALPAPEGDAFATRGYEAPSGQVEQAVAAIWAELLGAERVGRRDHFFELGGHSLLAVRVVSRVRQAMGVQVSPRDVFERPVLADFARGLKTAAGAEAAAIELVDRTGNVPLSFAQQRLWFLEQLGGMGAAYHIPMSLRLQGELDRGALVRSLDRIVTRHEALRTTFAAVDGEPVQRIVPVEESAFRLVEHDLRASADAEDELRRLVSDEAGAPFDLEHGPLVRGRLVRRAADDHVLLMTMHHIVSDAWSAGVLFRELAALYAAFAHGEPDPLPPLPVQYADYAAWHRRWVGGEVLESQAAYWTRTLAGAPELLELPADHPRPARQDFAGASLKVELDEAVTASLRTLSRRHGTTLYMTLLAGWAAVLSRLSGQDDVVIGTPSANRGRSEIEGLIGFFVNTLPVRVDLSGAPTVAEALGRVKARALEAQQNQDIPFEQVVERVQPARSLAYSPLFQVMFAWQNASASRLELPGLRLAPADIGPRVTAKFDLLLSLWEADGRIGGDVEYATSLFERGTVERWLGYLSRMLEGMAADGRLDRIPILPEAERRQVLREWNATDAAYPREACVHELVEARVERTPGAVAVVFEGERVTYAQLNARANRLAHHLRALGVGPDARVGICVERSVEMVVGLLGILKAGGAYVPLDSSYPVDRLRFMLADSAPAVLLTHPPLAATVAELSAGSAVPVLDLTRDEAWAHRPKTNPGREALGPRNLAHVLFTSGSTGRPKGVMLEHGSLVNRLAWMQDRYGMEAHEALLQKTPFSFDVSFWEFFWPLMVGARLVMARPDGHRDPAYLAEVIRCEGITTAHFVPSMLQLFLEHPEAERCTGLLRVPVSGEAISAGLVRQFHERLPGVGLFNQYGPTESGEVTERACDPDAERVSIGRAIHNSAVYVLDRAGEPVPVGVAGELFIGGVAVARGYLGRPRLTAERFVPDPFGEPGARMYRTGDLCRWLEESAEVRECVSAEVGSGSADSRTNALTHSRTGFLEYLGRTDFQVKVRGFRVELGEIEARLAAHPGIRETVVLAPDDAAGGKRLVAYFVGEALESEALRAHLAEQLPEYMVPAAFVRLERLPLNPNGKLDRKALPAPDAGAFAARAWEAPLGETEEALAKIWAELLGIERIGRRDDFFALGGHSLLAVRVVSRVRQALGVEVGISDLFVRPVLADFARGLQTATGAEGTAIVPVDRSGPLALSFAQQRLWFIEQMQGAGAAYHLSMRLRLKGELDREALMRALERIVARHEALRTSFPETDGVPAQRISAVEESPFHLAEHDFRAAPDAEEELGRLVVDEAGVPFDLARGPLIRGRLIRLANDDHVLLITMHHIVSDGWSMGIFTRELSALYGAFRGGRPDPLPPLPVQYADYAAWQRRWVEGEVLQRQADYWRETLSGAPELLELPTDRARPARQDFAGAAIRLVLDDELAAALKALGQRHGTTLYMTLLAGWAAVLARLSGQDDVVVGTPTANRGRAEVEDLIGFFVNTLPVRVDLSGAPTVAELLGRVKERSLGAQHHQDIPFEQVVELVQPARSLAHTPLFQVMLAWQNAPEGRLELPGLAPGPLNPARSGDSSWQAAARFDLSLALWEDGARIEGVVEYATALFERETVERYVGYLRRVLKEMAADASTPVHRLELLSAAERRTVVEEWNVTDAAFPARACAHELFEAQVERTPGAVAVSLEGARLTYAELNARANRLAHHVRALGVGPEVRVAVCVKRGLETVVAMLAVLKTGGAYVPLDPGNPEDRLRYALADSAPAALLTGGPLAARFADAGVPIVDMENPAAWDAHPASDPDRARVGVGPEHLAYVIYTSGSTGRPKGVLVRHGSLVSLLAVTRAAFGVGPGDVMPALAASAFDISLFEFLLPLISGAEVRMVAPQRVMDARALLGEITDATLLHAVPALMRDIAQIERRAPSLARLRGAFVGGDQVPADLLAEMSAAFPAARTHVLYGPTEGTILASAHAVPADGAVVGNPIGRPLGNVRLYVCDALGEPQPVGVAGELLIGGMGVARGYLGRAALTAERFVPDPFSAVPGARLYRTGDRARWRESAEVRECVSAEVSSGSPNSRTDALTHSRTDALTHSRTGVLEFLGRTDFQVKIRGFRIELGEIEARLREHPAVHEAVVLAREDAPGKKRLVAYVVGEAAADALKAHLEARVPGYMVPAAYVRLEALPLTSNGKLDRRALPVPDGAAYARRAHEPPRTMAEQVLAAIWCEVLEVKWVGRRDHFFDLGGHSLLAVRMVAKVREALNPAATVDEVFAHPTLYDLAARLQGDGEWFGTTHAIPVRETGSEPPLFVAHDAVGIVFYGQILRPHLDAEIPVYALPGPLNDKDEITSLDDVVTRLVRMMTEVQPQGPYRVAGWSAGGIFAYAVAERLVRTGRAVEFVGLLDALHPSRVPPPDTPRERQFAVLDLLARDTGTTPATPEALQALREDTEGMDLPAFIAACKTRGLLPETVTVDRAEQVDSRIALLKRSHAEFVPGPLPVSVHIFSSDDAGDNPRRGWEDLPGGAPFRVERVPGTHHTMWKKGNVEMVGAVISRAIRESAAGDARS
jgi:amino acid adenylation domain-containing protein